MYQSGKKNEERMHVNISNSLKKLIQVNSKINLKYKNVYQYKKYLYIIILCEMCVKRACIKLEIFFIKIHLSKIPVVQYTSLCVQVI